MIHSFIFLTLLSWCYASDVILTCIGACNITNNHITGGEGENITLKYTVTITNFATLTIDYGVVPFITVIPGSKKLKIKNPPSFLDTNETKLITLAHGFEFSFGIPWLNRSLQEQKFVSHLIDLDGNPETDSKAVNVLFQPKLLDWQMRHFVLEHVDTDVTFQLEGNPKPSADVYIDGRHYDASASGSTTPYTYTTSLHNVSRWMCERQLLIEANGFGRFSINVTLFQVQFTPEIPRSLSVSQPGASCLDVKWDPIDSGECSVNYTVLYYYIEAGNTTANRTDVNSTGTYKAGNGSKTTTGTTLRLCFPIPSSKSFNVSLRVGAEVYGMQSAFSRVLDVRVLPAENRTTVPPTTSFTTTPITTTPINTTTAAPSTAASTTQPITTAKTPSSKNSQQTIIIVIVIGVIVVLLIVFIVLVKRGKIRFGKGQAKVHVEHHTIHSSASNDDNILEERESPVGGEDEPMTEAQKKIESDSEKGVETDSSIQTERLSEVGSDKDIVAGSSTNTKPLAEKDVENGAEKITETNGGF